MFKKESNDEIENVYEKLRAEREEMEERELKETKKRNDGDLAHAIELDAEEKIKAREFKPNVRMVDYAAGQFLCYGDFEAPRYFIESVEIGDRGHPPYIKYRVPGYSEVSIGRALINVTMASGQVHRIECSRHELDILFYAIATEWKTARVN